MNLSTRRPLALLGLALSLTLILAGPLAAQDNDDQTLARRIETLVGRLSDDSFEVRDQATAELVEIGQPALDALATAAASEDPEVAWRAKKTIDRIEARMAEGAPDAPDGPRSRGPEVDPQFEELFRDMPGGEELKKMLEEAFRGAFDEDGQGGGRFFFRNLELDGTRRQTIETDGKTVRFETTRDGRIRGSVETEEGGETVRREFDYASEADLEKADPELHAVYAANAGRGQGFQFREGPFRFQFRSEGFEGLEKQLEDMQKQMERAFGGGGEGLDEMRKRLERFGDLPEGTDRELERALEEARRRGFDTPAPGGQPAEESFDGLTGSAVDAALRAQLDVPAGQGLLVSGVEAGSPAEADGFEPWDLILSAGGTPIDSIDGYRRLIEGLDEGRSATVSIIRRGQRREIEVVR